jgi:hypothetical protein
MRHPITSRTIRSLRPEAGDAMSCRNDSEPCAPGGPTENRRVEHGKILHPRVNSPFQPVSATAERIMGRLRDTLTGTPMASWTRRIDPDTTSALGDGGPQSVRDRGLPWLWT